MRRARPLTPEALAEAIAYFSRYVRGAVSSTPASWWADKYGARLLASLEKQRAVLEEVRGSLPPRLERLCEEALGIRARSK